MTVYTGPRIETFWVDLLDGEERFVRRLDTLRDGTVEKKFDSTVQGGCKLTIDFPDIQFLSARFRPWVRVNSTSTPLGVFLATSPEESWFEGVRTWEIGGLDKLTVLSEDAVEETFSLASGTFVIPEVRNQINAAGETAMVVTDSLATLREPIVWPAGTTRLKIVNDLLQAINYRKIWADGYGRYRVEPWSDPSSRPVKHVFEAGDRAIHMSEWTRTQDLAAVPNKVILTTSGTDDKPALRAVARNENPNSPYSYQSRGRWVTQVHTDVEAVDQETIDGLAKRYLSEASSPVAHYKAQHAFMPMDPQDIMRWRTGGRDALVMVSEFKIPLSPGQMTETLLVEVN